MIPRSLGNCGGSASKPWPPIPADRYASAKALAESLESYLRRPLLIAALALIVLVPAVAVGVWSRWPSNPPSPTPQVVFQQRRLPKRACRRVDCAGLVERRGRQARLEDRRARRPAASSRRTSPPRSPPQSAGVFVPALARRPGETRACSIRGRITSSAAARQEGRRERLSTAPRRWMRG